MRRAKKLRSKYKTLKCAHFYEYSEEVTDDPYPMSMHFANCGLKQMVQCTDYAEDNPNLAYGMYIEDMCKNCRHFTKRSNIEIREDRKKYKEIEIYNHKIDCLLRKGLTEKQLSYYSL